MDIKLYWFAIFFFCILPKFKGEMWLWFMRFIFQRQMSLHTTTFLIFWLKLTIKTNSVDPLFCHNPILLSMFKQSRHIHLHHCSLLKKRAFFLILMIIYHYHFDNHHLFFWHSMSHSWFPVSFWDLSSILPSQSYIFCWQLQDDVRNSIFFFNSLIISALLKFQVVTMVCIQIVPALVYLMNV